MIRPDLSTRQQIEIDYWRDSPSERPESDSLDNIINKAGEAGILLDLLQRYEADFARARDILELGGGQGWASCIVKRRFPDARVLLTDISEHAIASVCKWERIFETRIDGAYPCRSYEIPVPDASQDLIFCFAAAHHFVAHRRTFGELARVLRPGGIVLYLYEPSCRPEFYKRVYERVNRKRPEVPEDVLIHPKMRTLAEEAGFSAEVHFYPSVRYRTSASAMVYYSVLARLGWFQSVLPCSANFRFVKSARRRRGPAPVQKRR